MKITKENLLDLGFEKSDTLSCLSDIPIYIWGAATNDVYGILRDENNKFRLILHDAVRDNECSVYVDTLEEIKAAFKLVCKFRMK